MRRAIALTVAALVLGACAGRHAPVSPISAAARGHGIAVQRCAACHGVEPGSVSPRPLAPPFASREMRATAGLDGRLASLTSKGHYEMPPLALRPAEVEDLLAYIASLDAH